MVLGNRIANGQPLLSTGFEIDDALVQHLSESNKRTIKTSFAAGPVFEKSL